MTEGQQDSGHWCFSLREKPAVQIGNQFDHLEMSDFEYPQLGKVREVAMKIEEKIAVGKSMMKEVAQKVKEKKTKRTWISLLGEKAQGKDQESKARKEKTEEKKVEEEEAARPIPLNLLIDSTRLQSDMEAMRVLGVDRKPEPPVQSCYKLSDWKKEIVDGEGTWYQLKSVVDSGCGAPVAPPELAPFVPKQESAGSKRGQVFLSASKHEMANVGEKECRGFSDEGRSIATTYQIIDGVERPLDSVSSTCDKGNWVAFGKNGGYIECLKTGERTFFHREDDIYVRTMWMLMEAKNGAQDNPGFPRQGQ